MTGSNWVRVGAVLGFLAVALGAFGAHGLKAKLDALGTGANYQTAVLYHMFHALAILGVGLLARVNPENRAVSVAGWSFLLGVLVFSGSLYVLALTGMKWLGAITPIGGLAMLVGWAALAAGAPQTPGQSGWTVSSPDSTMRLEEPHPAAKPKDHP